MDMIGAAALIAQVAHEVNRSYCDAIGDNSQQSWHHAPGWQKESAIKGVLAHLASPGMTPEDSHKSWLDEKVKHGWRWGPVKDAEQKIHPCFCAYAELPQEQKIKDHLFGAVVRAFQDAARAMKDGEAAPSPGSPG